MRCRLAILVVALPLLVVALPGPVAMGQQQVLIHTHEERTSVEMVINGYVTLAWLVSRDSLAAARQLERAVDELLARPTPESLVAARDAWKAARIPFGQAEVFHFDQPSTARLNAWPINPSHLDYVKDNANVGLVTNPTVAINRENLLKHHLPDDHHRVAIGFHAIEFLLWGEPATATGPGERPVSDFRIGDPIARRRGQYLKLITQMLVEDLEARVADLAPDKPNGRAKFESLAPSQAVAHMLTGMAVLAHTDLAQERLLTALDPAHPQPQYAPFSDNTHADLAANIQGLRSIWSGSHTRLHVPGLSTLVRQANRQLGVKIEANLLQAESLVAQIEPPFGAILSSETDSPQRQNLKLLAITLQGLANNLLIAGESLGVEVATERQ